MALCRQAGILAIQSINHTKNASILGTTFLQVRHKTWRHMPQKKKKNPFVDRHTDFIKHLCIALVKHERVFTTMNKAIQAQEYGDLLITLTQRREPPPDLYMIKNGFVLTEEEAIETRMKRRIMNRMSRRVFIPPRKLTEEQYVEKCKTVINDILLGDTEALDKLYGTLLPRFDGKYGGFVKVTPVPCQEKRLFPRLAYAEYVENNLKPLPVMPTLVKGRLKAFPRDNMVYTELDTINDSVKDSVSLNP